MERITQYHSRVFRCSEVSECLAVVAQDRELCERVTEHLLEHLLHRTPYEDRTELPMPLPKDRHKKKAATTENVGVRGQ